MIKAIAIDDEKNAVGIIREFCSRFDDIKLTETFTDPVKALSYFTHHSDIDLLFLDIQMTRLNGLVLASQLSSHKTKIILTTAYPDYALQGYELDVVDYLLKPFSFHRFERAINKARSFLNSQIPSADRKSIPRLSPGFDDFIFIHTDYKTIRVNVSDIFFIEGSGNYVTLHTPNAKIMALQNLKLFEEQLQPYQFIRIHKSYIISIKYVDAIEKNSVRIAQRELPIGDTYKEAFLEFMRLNYRQY